ncbi:hypothetical protein AND_006947 [Anopheles darlingi]|uniref:Fatty acyl-CoA reductase n=1 Tax=Anopheles darlingi TaxID=43151 RepID=W5JBN0_ANODA|nr:hypothetical protein AND_006947 [Anopheles darlingi]
MTVSMYDDQLLSQPQQPQPQQQQPTEMTTTTMGDNPTAQDHPTAVTMGKIDEKLTEIQQFYDKCSIFITGGTGFLGKTRRWRRHDHHHHHQQQQQQHRCTEHAASECVNCLHFTSEKVPPGGGGQLVVWPRLLCVLRAQNEVATEGLKVPPKPAAAASWKEEIDQRLRSIEVNLGAQRGNSNPSRSSDLPTSIRRGTRHECLQCALGMVESLGDSCGAAALQLLPLLQPRKIGDSNSVVATTTTTTIARRRCKGEHLRTSQESKTIEALIYKLLTSCPGIENIFLLVRSKRGKDIFSRVEEIFDDAMFDKMKQTCPKYDHKIRAVAGDCMQPALGISASDREILAENVNIVFHLAATVRFDEKMKTAMQINVKACRDVLDLCHDMKHLKSVIYVSTAYTQCPQPVVEERFYDPPLDSEKMIHLTDCVTDGMIEKITPVLLDKWPNTYTFTKAIAEDVVRKNSRGMPVGMFRPGIGTDSASIGKQQAVGAGIAPYAPHGPTSLTTGCGHLTSPDALGGGDDGVRLVQDYTISATSAPPLVKHYHAPLSAMKDHLYGSPSNDNKACRVYEDLDDEDDKGGGQHGHSKRACSSSALHMPPELEARRTGPSTPTTITIGRAKQCLNYFVLRHNGSTWFRIVVAHPFCGRRIDREYGDHGQCASTLHMIATYQEPVPGWIDNFYGPTGVIAGAGTGVLRTLRADPTKVANMVPVDLCVNGIISSAWDVGERNRTEIMPDPEIPIYNFCTEPNNCITWGEFTNTTVKFGSMYPTMKAIWYLCYASNPNIVLHYLSIIFLHYAPAVIGDIIALLIGRKPRLLRSYKKIHRFMDVIEYFSMREWEFKMDNMTGLWRRLSSEDQKLFFFDMRQINWDYFLEQYFCGIRRYLLNDPMETVPQAVVRWNRLYWLHQAAKVVVLLLFYKLVMSVWGMLS